MIPHDTIYALRVSAEINQQLCDYRMQLANLLNGAYIGANADIRDKQIPIVKQHIATLEGLLKSLGQ